MANSVLVIGYGNPGRCDDGLGPALAEAVERLHLPGVTVEADYQLTVEDAAAAAAHRYVVFADASVGGREPFFFRAVHPAGGTSFSTHSVEPEAVLALARDLFQADTRGLRARDPGLPLPRVRRDPVRRGPGESRGGPPLHRARADGTHL